MEGGLCFQKVNGGLRIGGLDVLDKVLLGK